VQWHGVNPPAHGLDIGICRPRALYHLIYGPAFAVGIMVEPDPVALETLSSHQIKSASISIDITDMYSTPRHCHCSKLTAVTVYNTILNIGRAGADRWANARAVPGPKILGGLRPYNVMYYMYFEL